jgi:hypothetical protein
VTGRCAAPENFDQNWDEISIVLTLDGEVVELDQFVRLEGMSGGNQCRYYYTALTDWPIGEHILTTEMIFATSLDDGIQDTLYAPGSRIYEYHVYIGR